MPGIILYHPPSSAGRKPILPMSLLALGACLEGRYEYAILDGNLEPDPETRIKEYFSDPGPKLLAMTVMPGPQVKGALSLAKKIKLLLPETTIIWGGYFPTTQPEVCLRSRVVDVVVQGHAEGVFLELTTAIMNQAAYPSLPGTAFLDKASADLVSHPLAKTFPDWSWPEYPYSRLDLERYIRPTFLGSRTLSHHSSYGCPFQCSFCAVTCMTHGQWLAQPAAKVAKTVEYLARAGGINALEFYDNNFFASETRAREIADSLQPYGLAWWAQGRIDTLGSYAPETWEHLQASGLKMIFMGAESGSDEQLLAMNKGAEFSSRQTLELVARLKPLGIIPELSFVLGSPDDPIADTRQTLDFVRKIKKINSLAEIILYLYTPEPVPGSLFAEAQAKGFSYPATLDEWAADDWQDIAQRRSAKLPWISKKLRRHIQDFEIVMNAYYPSTTLAGQQPRILKLLLKTFSSWRYALKVYAWPLELKLLRKFYPFQRPDTSGF